MCEFTESTAYIAELRKERAISRLSFDPASGIIRGTKGKPLRRIDRYGYLAIHSNGQYLGAAHRLIWESVHGPIPDGMQINHINGIKTDNRIQNLEIVTAKQNIQHSIKTGLRNINKGIKTRRLSAETVLAIRDKHASGMNKRKLAREFSVCRKTITQIVERLTWKQLPDRPSLSMAVVSDSFADGVSA